MRIFLTLLFALCLPLVGKAEYSRTYLDSYPLQMAAVGELDIAYRIVEPGPDKPKVVVIMGLGGSNVAWGDALISGLANGGYEVLLLDNRDTGASTRFDEWGQPLLWWELLKYRLGFSVNAPYTLNDMGADIAGLMDAVGYNEAHIIGASMGRHDCPDRGGPIPRKDPQFDLHHVDHQCAASTAANRRGGNEIAQSGHRRSSGGARAVHS